MKGEKEKGLWLQVIDQSVIANVGLWCVGKYLWSKELVERSRVGNVDNMGGRSEVSRM